MFDVIILDTSNSPYEDLYKNVAVKEADNILLVTNIGIREFSSMRRWIINTQTPVEKGGFGVNLDKIKIVINKLHESRPLNEETLAKASHGVSTIAYIPLDSFVFQKYYSMGKQNEIIEEHEHIAKAFFSLATKITNKADIGIAVALSPIINNEDTP